MVPDLPSWPEGAERMRTSPESWSTAPPESSVTLPPSPVDELVRPAGLHEHAAAVAVAVVARADLQRDRAARVDRERARGTERAVAGAHRDDAGDAAHSRVGRAQLDGTGAGRCGRRNPK